MSVGILLAFFYNVVVSWSLWYLGVSFLSFMIPEFRLEWAYCGHSYNTESCHSNLDDKICAPTIDNFTAAVNTAKEIIALNGTCSAPNQVNVTSSVEEYWNREILGHVGHDWSHFVRNHSFSQVFCQLSFSSSSSLSGYSSDEKRFGIIVCMAISGMLPFERGQNLWPVILLKFYQFSYYCQ